MAAVAATRGRCIRRDIPAAHPDPEGRFSNFAVQAAHGNHHDFRGRRLRLGGVAPAGRGQGRGRIAAGGLLHQARSGGVDRVSRQRRRIAVAADPLAGARQAQSCGIAGRRRHAARGGTGCGLCAVGFDSPQRTDADGHRPDRRAREYRARRRAGASTCRGRRDERCTATWALPGSMRCWSIRRPGLALQEKPSPGKWARAICRCRMPMLRCYRRRCWQVSVSAPDMPAPVSPSVRHARSGFPAGCRGRG